MPWFNRGKFALLSGGGGVNWASADIRALLVTSAYSFNADSNFVADIVASELSTTNYARQSVANRTVTEDDTNDRVSLDADNVTFANLGPASGGPVIGGIALFVHTGADATATLIAFIPFTQQVNGSNVVVAWHADGVLTLS